MSLYIDIEKKVGEKILKVKINQECKKLVFLGQSGSGKSMTLKCIAGLETPDKGRIILNNKVLFDSDEKVNLPPQDRKVGFLFQNYGLFPHMTVKKNIEIGINKLQKKDREELSQKYINKLKLNGLENRYPYELSGGQAQRVALARVLVTEPEILLLDEPFSALDYHLRKNIELEISEILNEYNKNSIIVTHDIEEAYRMCENILVYEDLEAKVKKNRHDLFNNPSTVLEAKITGCKNISRVKILEDKTIYAIDWDLIIENIKVKNFKYIGIRENNISIDKVEDSRSNEFVVENIIENPETVSVFLRKDKSKKAIEVRLKNKDLKLVRGNRVSININGNEIYYLN